MGRKPKNPKLEHGVNAGTDDLSESANEEHDDMGGPVSPSPTKESEKGKGIGSSAPTEEATGNEKSLGSSAPTEEATGNEKSLVSSAPTVEAMTENIVTGQLNSSQPGPSSSKQTLEQQVEYLMQTVNSFKAPEDNYKTLYLESQKKVEALTKENHGLQIKFESAVAKVEVYDKMRETFGSLKELVFVSKLTKGSEVLAEMTSQLESTAPAVATQPPLKASTPKSATRGSTSQATTSAVAGEPGSSELRRSKRGKNKELGK